MGVEPAGVAHRGVDLQQRGDQRRAVPLLHLAFVNVMFVVVLWVFVYCVVI